MQTIKQQFETDVGKAMDPEWLAAWRREAYDRFSQLGMPSRRHEQWRYTQLRWDEHKALPLAQGSEELTPRQSPFAESMLAAHLVFRDGDFQLGESQVTGNGITVTPLRQLGPEIVAADHNWQDSLLALNHAMGMGGIHIQLSGVIGTILIDHQAVSPEIAAFPRVLIEVKERSRATVVEHFTSDHGHVINGETRIKVAGEAVLKHQCIQQLAAGSSLVHHSDYQVAGHGEVYSHKVDIGNGQARHNTKVTLAGLKARADMGAVYLCGPKNHCDHNTHIVHAEPDTSSRQVYKGVIGRHGKGVFSGKITVARGAQGISAQQLNNNLLLSDEGAVHTKPQLEIDADDVKCSHGATVGSLQQDELFYLASRGIPWQTARIMLAEGFVAGGFTSRDEWYNAVASLCRDKLESLL